MLVFYIIFGCILYLERVFFFEMGCFGDEGIGKE